MRARSRPSVIGHRGAPGYRPEHTRASYELAFALGADSVEPDLVATKDGVLVVRHENEISGTTNVAEHPEFASRRTTKEVDGMPLTGWFTEDFTWAELATLRARERVPQLRQASATFDDRYPILRLSDVLEVVDAASDSAGRALGLVAELKHATYFEAAGLPLHELFLAELAAAGWSDHPGLVAESFEKTVLGRLHDGGFRGKRVYLLEAEGAPADRVASLGAAAPGYASDLTLRGLYALGSAASPAERVDGISVDVSQILHSGSVAVGLFGEDEGGVDIGAVTSDLVDLAHSAGLFVYCWTLRPENGMLPADFRRSGRDDEWGDWRRLFAILLHSGVDGVFADHPDLAVAVRDGR